MEELRSIWVLCTHTPWHARESSSFFYSKTKNNILCTFLVYICRISDKKIRILLTAIPTKLPSSHKKRIPRETLAVGSGRNTKYWDGYDYNGGTVSNVFEPISFIESFVSVVCRSFFARKAEN